MSVVQSIVAEHGDLFYLITFLWTALEGETFVLFAGYAASLGILDLWPLLACAWLGSFLGDQIYFQLGRRFGPVVLDRFPRWRPGVDRALRLLARYDAGFVLSFRFIYGVRNFSSFAMGLSPLRWRRFAMLNFVAAGLWASAFVGAGYLFGGALSAVMGEAATVVGVVLLVVFVAVVTLLMRRRPLPAE